MQRCAATYDELRMRSVRRARRVPVAAGVMTLRFKCAADAGADINGKGTGSPDGTVRNTWHRHTCSGMLHMRRLELEHVRAGADGSRLGRQVRQRAAASGKWS